MAVFKEHGTRARIYVSSRIGALAMTGDNDGIRRWTEIAARLDEIMQSEKQ